MNMIMDSLDLEMDDLSCIDCCISSLDQLPLRELVKIF